MYENFNEKLCADLKNLGLKPGDTVLVHTSLRALGVSAGELADTLLSLLTEKGTLVVPAFSYFTSNKENPFFDVNETPSNLGYFPEYFRLNLSPVRSVCPSHSCCAKGRNADFITSGHIKDDTPCGKNSPFVRVSEVGGKILFLGCTAEPNSTMHAVEELVNPPYLFGENTDYVEYTVRDKDGKCFKMRCAAHYFDSVAQRYERLVPLMPKDKISVGKVMGAECILMDSEAVFKTALEYYKKDPLYFIDKLN